MSDELSNATRIAALEDYNQRLLAENVRLNNEAATERERCGVLEREVGKWRAWCDAEDSVAISEPLLWQDVVNARRETDTRHALDAAKFEGGGQ
jgi:hypothetical protein